MSITKVNLEMAGKALVAEKAAEASGKAVGIANETVKGFNALPERQKRLVLELWRTGDVDESWKKAGVANRAEADLILSSETVSKVLKTRRKSMLSTVDAEQARRTIVDLMGKNNPATVRLAAAKVVLEIAGDMDKADRTGDKALADMTPAELMAFIASQRAVVAKQSEPLMIDVIPS
jgi:hypothetical protein